MAFHQPIYFVVINCIRLIRLAHNYAGRLFSFPIKLPVHFKNLQGESVCFKMFSLTKLEEKFWEFFGPNKRKISFFKCTKC